MRKVDIEIMSPQTFESALTGLSVILEQCVQQQASIGFVFPFGIEEATHYWLNNVLEKIKTEKIVLFIARIDDIVVGTVQLDIGMPDNQQHRADVAKLLVHPLYQRKGIAKIFNVSARERGIITRQNIVSIRYQNGG